jgi:hypothetical protein
MTGSNSIRDQNWASGNQGLGTRYSILENEMVEHYSSILPNIDPLYTGATTTVETKRPGA